MDSINSSLLGNFNLGSATQEALMNDLGDLLTPHGFEIQSAVCEEGKLDDGMDEMISQAMDNFLCEVDEKQKKREKINIISNKVIRKPNKAPKRSVLKNLLTMPSTITKNKRVFYDAVKNNEPSSERVHIVPHVQVIEGPGELSPPKVPQPESVDRPISPVISSRFKYKKSPKKTNEPRSKPDCASINVPISQPDWSSVDFTTSQIDSFSRAYVRRSDLRKEFNEECQTLQKHEDQVKKLKQELLEAEERVKNSKKIIATCKDKLVFLNKYFSFK